ncbi:N-6 DNA methylase [Ectobacillus antri]|uniref:site-specific DNA-methyltransferase (adenine-specific) n=1 Tax=Ectobacillus antri TaxID=2486280 RepID=A0ABT6H8S0_9BACI|nr:N-6 DNA methylase [Ectobacillus antri]MDG4658207.1 N-6 DNA methylase [Ectobacillus antri]MDG5755273.1 N-6 DNA methylase [Ectobacillus antri]
MENVEAKAVRTIAELSHVLRWEPFYKEIITKMFFAKFILVNKQHPYQISSDITWARISAPNANIGYYLDEVFHILEAQYQLSFSISGDFSFSRLSEPVLDEALLVMDQFSLTEAEFQDFNLTGAYFQSLVEQLGLRERKESVTTPEGLNQLMVRIVQPNQGTVYDGAAGIGSTLIAAHEFSKHIQTFGQELLQENVVLAYMNAIVHGVNLEQFQIAEGDTLFAPQFTEGEKRLTQFDYVLMNPPFGMKLDERHAAYDPYGRFNGRMGKTSRVHGDLAFLQHTVASLGEMGKAAVIVPTGVLMRSSGAEKGFREYAINTDIIETIVLLPHKLYPFFAIQTVLLVFNKNKPQARKGFVQFINAEEMFEGTRSQNILQTKHIDDIVSKYEHYTENGEDSRVVTIEEIRNNEYILNPKQYFTSQTVASEFGEVTINKLAYEKMVKHKKSFKQVADLSRGVNLPSKSMLKEGETYKVIQLKDVEDGVIYFDNVDDIAVQNAERYTVQAGDILIASRGTAFKVAIVPEHEGTFVLSNMFIRIRIYDQTSYLPEYVKAFIESPVGMAFLEGVQKGGAVRVLTTSDIENIEFPDLSLEEQQDIVRVLAKTEAKYKELLQQAQEILRDGKLDVYKQMGLSNVIEGV